MSYTDEQLVNALQPYADSFNVILQAIYDQHALFLYLNRSPEVAADCPELVPLLKLQIANQFPDVHALYFYSRVLGEETIDWEAHFEIPQVKNARRSARTLKLVSSSEVSTQSPVGSIAQGEASNRENTLIQERTQGQVSQIDPAQDTARSEATQEPLPAQRSSETDEEPAIAAVSSSDAQLEPEMGLPDPNEFTLQKFSFTRNRRLVEGSLQNPKPDIAEIVKFFHELDEDSKRQLLPLLENWFKDPEKVDTTTLPEAWQTWLNRISSDPQRMRSTGVWLSRYCFDPAKAMSQVQATFAGIAEAEAAYSASQRETQASEDSEASQEDRPPQQGANGRVSAKAGPSSSAGTVSAKSKTKSFSKKTSKVKQSQSFSPDELVPIGATLLAVLVLGWLLSGSVRATGGFGVLAAVCAIGSGIAFIFGNNSIRGMFSIVLFLLWLLSPLGLLVFWVELIGGVLGMAIGGAMLAVVKQSEAPSILSPKPLRLAIVASLGLLLVLGPAIFGGVTGSGPISGGNAISKGKELTTHVATGAAVRASQRLEFKGALAVWYPTEQVLQITLLPVPVTTGDLELVKVYFQQEDPDEDLAVYLTDDRASHDLKQFPTMPIASLLIKFVAGAATFDQTTVEGYLFYVGWPQGTENAYSIMSSAISGKRGLTLLTFNPIENGALSLLLQPDKAGGPENSEDFEGQKMTVDLNVQTQVMLKPQKAR